MIANDPAFPKNGRKGELLGRIFSHIKHTSILGNNGQFLLFADRKTQTFVGYSLQGEMEKTPACPEGMEQKQLDARYSKERDADSRAAKRSEEYFQSKKDNLIRRSYVPFLKEFASNTSWWTVDIGDRRGKALMAGTETLFGQTVECILRAFGLSGRGWKPPPEKGRHTKRR